MCYDAEAYKEYEPIDDFMNINLFLQCTILLMLQR